MVSGSAPSYFGGRFKAAWIGLGVMLGALFLLGFLLLGLNFAVHVPENTVVLATLTPKDASSIMNEDVLNALSPIWKQALEGTSSWPVILGAAPGENGWQTFAIVPRWRDKAFLAPHIKAHAGLLTLVTTETALSTKKDVKYIREIPGIRDQAAFWINLLPLLEKNSSFTNEKWKIEPFTATLNKKEIQSSVSFQSQPKTTPLTNADVVINGLDNIKTADSKRLLASVSFGDVSLADLLIDIARVTIWTDREGNVTKKEADFTQKITEDQARMLLAGLGVVQKDEIQLPDGTITKERLALDVSAEQLFTQHATDRFGDVNLQEDRVSLGDLTVSSSVTVVPCVSRPVLRLSSEAVHRIFNIITGKSIERLPAIQLGEEKNRLTLCTE